MFMCCCFQVQVGDIVKVKNKEFFPADLLLLSSRLVKSIEGSGLLSHSTHLPPTFFFFFPSHFVSKLCGYFTVFEWEVESAHT